MKAVGLWPALMLAVVGLVSVLVLLLLATTIWLSFHEGRPGEVASAASLANYAAIFGSSLTYGILANSLGFSLTTTGIALAVGIPAAWLVERTDFHGKGLLFAFMTIGLLIPGFADAMGWLFLLHPRIGLINIWLMRLFGLSQPVFNIASVFGMGCVQGLSLAPVAFIMTAAVFRAMDPALEEAALVSGADRLATFRRVSLRLAWPGVCAAMIYIFTLGFSAFDVPAIIGWSNRVYTFSTYLLFQLRPDDTLPRFGLAAALATIVIVFAGALSYAYAQMQRQARYYQVVTGKAYRPSELALGRGRFAAWLFLVLYVVLSKLCPIGFLAWASFLPFFQVPSAAAFASLSLRNYDELPWELIAAGLRNTFVLMLLVPTITLLVSFCFSWIVLRTRIKGRAFFDVMAFLPHAIPAVIFGLSALLFVLYATGPYVPLDGTLAILLIVLVIARASYATRMTNSGLIQIHSELEESAQVSGAGLGTVIARIVVPLLGPTLGYTWLWIALLTFRELTLVVMLTTRSNMTLPVVTWSIWMSGASGQASALTLILLTLMIPFVALYWFVTRKRSVFMRV
jgi:iron(III) transport system permease protein